MVKEISNFNLHSKNNNFSEESILKSINQLKGVDNILINSSTKKVMVEYNPDKLNIQDIVLTFEKQGYVVS